MFGDKFDGGPSVGFVGYRRELDSFGIDVSFFNLQYQSSDRTYNYYGSTGSSGQNGEWLKLEFLHFATPLSDRSLYFGAGMGWSVASLDNDNRSWSGSGLQGDLSAGYELGRASTIRVFIQTDVGLPFYKQRSDSYLYSPTTSVRDADGDRTPLCPVAHRFAGCRLAARWKRRLTAWDRTRSGQTAPRAPGAPFASPRSATTRASTRKSRRPRSA